MSKPEQIVIIDQRRVMRGQAQRRSQAEIAINKRGADVYAGFLLAHLRPDMTVLDCGCGEAAITFGLAEAVPDGRVVGVDLDEGSLVTARRSATSIEQRRLTFIAADGRHLPFHDAAFDAVLCHSMLETLGDPASVVAELRRVTKRQGVVGAASVEYSGIIVAGEQTAAPLRFYDIRQQLWRAAGVAEPNMVVAYAGFFRRRGSAVLKRSPTISATGRQIR